MLGSAGEGRVDLVASVAPALVARGVRAGEIVKLAAAEVGGGGGGRDTMARAGGRDPDRLPEAIEAARGGDRVRARRREPCGSTVTARFDFLRILPRKAPAHG